MALDESENCGLESSRKSDVHDRQAGQLGMKYIGGIIIKDSISSTETPHLEVPMTTRIQNLLAKPTFTISIKDIVAAETLLELFRNPRNFSIPKTSIQTSRNLSHARSDLYLGEASNCSRENLEALENRQQLQAYNFIEVSFTDGTSTQKSSKKTIQEPKNSPKETRIGRGISHRDSRTSGKHTAIKPKGWMVRDDGIDRSRARIHEPDALKFIFRFSTEKRNPDNSAELITGDKIVYRYLHQAGFDWNDRKSILSLNTWRGQVIRRLFSTHWVAKEKEEIMILVHRQLDQDGYIRFNRLANEYNSNHFGVVTHLAGEKKLEAKGKTRTTLQTDREAPWRTSGSIHTQLNRWPEYKKLFQINRFDTHPRENKFQDDEEILEPCPASLSIQRSLQDIGISCQPTSKPTVDLKENTKDTAEKYVKSGLTAKDPAYASPYINKSYYSWNNSRSIEYDLTLRMDPGSIPRGEALTDNPNEMERPVSPSEESSEDL